MALIGLNDFNGNLKPRRSAWNGCHSGHWGGIRQLRLCTWTRSGTAVPTSNADDVCLDLKSWSTQPFVTVISLRFLTSPRILLTTVSAPLASTSINSNSNVTQRSPSVKTLKLLCQAIETRVVKWLERLEAKHSLPSSMCIRSGMPFAKTSWSWCEPSWATAMAFGE